jgi:hypothetical protein
MIITNLLSFALLAAPIIASPLTSTPSLKERALAERSLFDDTIKDVLNGVIDSTKSLTAAVQNFSGNVADAGPIVEKSTGLLSTISSGTATIQGADSLSLLGLLGILPSVLSLNSAVEGVSNALIDQKPKFDAAGLSTVVLSQLQDQQKAAQGLVDTLLSKLPSYIPSSLGQILSSPSLEALAKAISVYSAPASAPTS